MNIENYFQRDLLINNLAKYDLFYQVTLGNIISITNTKDLNYDIELEHALGSMYELLKDLRTLDDETISFDEELKKQSAMDAVQNFANENLEDLKNGKIKIEDFVNSINDGIFFNYAMEVICEENINNQLENLGKSILNAIIELEKN